MSDSDEALESGEQLDLLIDENETLRSALKKAERERDEAREALVQIRDLAETGQDAWAHVQAELTRLRGNANPLELRERRRGILEAYAEAIEATQAYGGSLTGKRLALETCLDLLRAVDEGKR